MFQPPKQSARSGTNRDSDWSRNHSKFNRGPNLRGAFLKFGAPTPAMHRFLEGSVVQHIVYRGEYGASDLCIQTRRGSISFGDKAAANLYATRPNDTTDTAHSPRVIPVYLSIRNPVINNTDDPFIDISRLIDTIGRRKAEKIARKFSDQIENTNNWVENFSEFSSIADLLRRAPERLGDLYLDAYPIFDCKTVVGWFKTVGFDGAIHIGNSETLDTVEYKVFSCHQIRSAVGEGGLLFTKFPQNVNH